MSAAAAKTMRRNFQKRLTAAAALAAVLVITCSPAWASGDPARGNAKSATCAACHGPAGNAPVGQYPRLAGQYDMYLQQALHEYKDGRRENPIMVGMVTTLSEQDMADLAAYYASLPGRLDTLRGHIQGDH